MGDILFFSSSDWHGNWGSRQQVARLWAAAGHRVLFVEQMAGWEHFAKYPDLRQRRRQLTRPLRPQADNLWLLTPPPLLPGRYYWPLIARCNGRWLARWLQPYLAQLNFQKPLLWFYKPEQVALLPHLERCGAVYHCIDEFTVGTQGRKKRIIAALEVQLMQGVDLVFANSRLTFAHKRLFNRHTHHLPSGADVAHFRQVEAIDQPPHPAVAGLPAPVLAFVGNLNEKIDTALLLRIARERLNWTLLLIGSIRIPAGLLEALQQQSNVHLLGKRPFTDLPAYLRTTDLCLLPYVQGEATRYRSPLKLYEYLATGKPVVSTPHPEVDEFREIITIAAPDQFVAAIQQTLRAESAARKEQRLAAAATHSWEARFRTIIACLQANLKLGHCL